MSKGTGLGPGCTGGTARLSRLQEGWWRDIQDGPSGPVFKVSVSSVWWGVRHSWHVWRRKGGGTRSPRTKGPCSSAKGRVLWGKEGPEDLGHVDLGAALGLSSHPSVGCKTRESRGDSGEQRWHRDDAGSETCNV